MGQKRSRRRICASTALTTSDLAAARRTLIACCWGSAVVRAFRPCGFLFTKRLQRDCQSKWLCFLQNAFSAITNPDGCAWDEAELVHGKGNSFSAGCRFWAVLEAAGLKAFRKEVSSRSHLSESPVGMKHGDFAARTKSTRSRSIIFIKTSPSLL